MFGKVPRRLESISLVYLLFFVLAVLSPSLYTRDYFGLSESTLEEITIFIFGLAGLATFTIYERYMERREREREKIQTDYHRAKEELMESYAYIGSVNRKIELLKRLAQDTSHSLLSNNRFPKEVFQSLVVHACAASGARSALLRLVEHEPLRTEREFLHHAENGYVFRVPNRDLRVVNESNLAHSLVNDERGGQVIVIPADRHRGTYRAYLLLHHDQEIKDGDLDVSLLKIFVNQAESLYHQFCHVK